jgi:hypothetical protein
VSGCWLGWGLGFKVEFYIRCLLLCLLVLHIFSPSLLESLAASVALPRGLLDFAAFSWWCCCSASLNELEFAKVSYRFDLQTRFGLSRRRPTGTARRVHARRFRPFYA